MEPAEKKRAIATSIFLGLRDTALRFGRTLPKKDRQDWEQLAKHLRARFPEQEPKDRIQESIVKLSDLRQGQRTLREYIEDVQELALSIPDDWNQTVITMFTRGLSDSVTRRVLNAHVQSQKAISKTVTLDKVIRMAKACENDQEEVEEDIYPASRSQDKLFADALNNQT